MLPSVARRLDDAANSFNWSPCEEAGGEDSNAGGRRHRGPGAVPVRSDRRARARFVRDDELDQYPSPAARLSREQRYRAGISGRLSGGGLEVERRATRDDSAAASVYVRRLTDFPRNYI